MKRQQAPKINAGRKNSKKKFSSSLLVCFLRVFFFCHQADDADRWIDALFCCLAQSEQTLSSHTLLLSGPGVVVPSPTRLSPPQIPSPPHTHVHTHTHMQTYGLVFPAQLLTCHFSFTLSAGNWAAVFLQPFLSSDLKKTAQCNKNRPSLVPYFSTSPADIEVAKKAPCVAIQAYLPCADAVIYWRKALRKLTFDPQGALPAPFLMINPMEGAPHNLLFIGRRQDDSFVTKQGSPLLLVDVVTGA